VATGITGLIGPTALRLGDAEGLVPAEILIFANRSFDLPTRILSLVGLLLQEFEHGFGHIEGSRELVPGSLCQEARMVQR
jgi:hypothetical protein